MLSAMLPAYSVEHKTRNWHERWPHLAPEGITDAQRFLSDYILMLAAFGTRAPLLVAHRGFHWQPAALPTKFARGEPKNCFKNAATLALQHPDELTYVEGFGVCMVPAEHAWCVDRAGRVVDPTWPRPEGLTYFGVPFCAKFLAQSLSEATSWGLLGDVRDGAAVLGAVRNTVAQPWATTVFARADCTELDAVATNGLSAASPLGPPNQ
jgi:hypothetical protein